MCSIPFQEEDADAEWIRRKGKIAIRSEVWKHVKVDRNDENLVKCDYCSSTFSYFSSTTNIRRHLASNHQIKFKNDPKTTPPKH